MLTRHDDSFGNWITHYSWFVNFLNSFNIVLQDSQVFTVAIWNGHDSTFEICRIISSVRRINSGWYSLLGFHHFIEHVVRTSAWILKLAGCLCLLTGQSASWCFRISGQNSVTSTGLETIHHGCFCLVDINSNELQVNLTVTCGRWGLLIELDCVVNTSSGIAAW